MGFWGCVLSMNGIPNVFLEFRLAQKVAWILDLGEEGGLRTSCKPSSVVHKKYVSQATYIDLPMKTTHHLLTRPQLQVRPSPVQHADLMRV